MYKMDKLKSTWTPNMYLFFRQLKVSLISYLTLPFFKRKENGVQLFFERNYSKEKDDLIFDGNTTSYYDKLYSKEIKELLSGANIIDLGCGNASFYNWLKNNHITICSYMGLDFAVENKSIDAVCEIVNDNLLNFTNYLSYENNVIVLCNVLCYLTDDVINAILNKCPVGSVIIIIEPSPGIFWDAHFDGIKPKYRSVNTIERLLQKYRFHLLNTIQDYLVSINKQLYFFPLSYCICAKLNCSREMCPDHTYIEVGN